ncbi:MAG: PAS-domain containing protein, partial [Rickettsiales bacterium]
MVETSWIIGIVAILAGVVLGLLLARTLWQKMVTSGELPKGWPKKLGDVYFGDVGKAMRDQRRRKAEFESAQRELRQFSSLLNLAPFPIWRRTADMAIQYCNLSYHALLEEVPERVQEEHPFELSAQAGQLGQRALDEKHTVSERRHMVVEGSRRLYEVFEIPDMDLGGTVGFAIDVTKQEEVEEELRRQDGAHADLLEASNMATAIFGADKKLKFYNSAFMALWKLDEAWLEGEPSYSELLELLREKRRMSEVANFPAFKQQRLKLFTDLMEPHEEIAQLPDGKVLRVLIIPHALGGLIFSYEDVTDKMALESSYNTLIAVQRETLDNLHEGVAVFGEDGRLRLSNPVYQKLWGMQQNFLDTEPHIGEVLEATRAYYSYQDWDEFKERMMAQLHVRKMNYQRIERTDGSVIDWSTVPLPDGATLITYFDVTDSTLVERSLIEKNEALRDADHLKTEFLLSVSYELRSPLTSITGFARMLKDNYFGKLNDKQAEYVEAIYDSASQLGQLINNILDLASLEAGYMRLEITDFNVKETLEDVFKRVEARTENHDQKFTLKCPKNIGQLQADESRIKQVLMNLLNNAVNFTPAKGKITLGATADEGDNIVLWVEDTGAGIPKEEQTSVFERFRGGAVRTKNSGAGLGLATVKNFIELHGGRVELESEVG